MSVAIHSMTIYVHLKAHDAAAEEKEIFSLLDTLWILIIWRLVGSWQHRKKRPLGLCKAYAKTYSFISVAFLGK